MIVYLKIFPFKSISYFLDSLLIVLQNPICYW
jgi:hypothetical protein